MLGVELKLPLLSRHLLPGTPTRIRGSSRALRNGQCSRPYRRPVRSVAPGFDRRGIWPRPARQMGIGNARLQMIDVWIGTVDAGRLGYSGYDRLDDNLGRLQG